MHQRFHKLLRENLSLLLFFFCYFPHNLAHAHRFSGHDIGAAEGGKFKNCIVQKPKQDHHFINNHDEHLRNYTD